MSGGGTGNETDIDGDTGTIELPCRKGGYIMDAANMSECVERGNCTADAHKFINI